MTPLSAHSTALVQHPDARAAVSGSRPQVPPARTVPPVRALGLGALWAKRRPDLERFTSIVNEIVGLCRMGPKQALGLLPVLCH